MCKENTVNVYIFVADYKTILLTKRPCAKPQARIPYVLLFDLRRDDLNIFPTKLCFLVQVTSMAVSLFMSRFSEYAYVQPNF